MFFQHFVENKYLGILMGKIREFRYGGDIVKRVFGGIGYLLKGLGSGNGEAKEEQFIYLLVMISKEGFITENYKFLES